MSLMVLHHDKVLTLASKCRVVSPDDAGTLKTMLEQAASLSELLEGEHARIQKAESTAYEQGLESGFSAGKQDGLNAAAVELARERAALVESQGQLQHQAVQMAFEIVRKVAATLDPVDLLCALAITTARSCAPDEVLVLRVHDRYKQAIAEKLGSGDAETASLFKHIIGDTTVSLSACVIETQASRIVADLETQAELLERQLVNR